MAISIVKLGSPRKDKRIRIGAVRRPPRGVKKSDYAKKNYFDVWFPTLSPSLPLVKKIRGTANEQEWARFKRKFIAEMKSPEARHALQLLAVLSHKTDFSIGCYCEDEKHCHRSILRELLIQYGAKMD